MRLTALTLASTLALSAALTVTAEARPIRFAAQAPQDGGLVLPLASEADLGVRGAALDPAVRAAVARALASAKFDYKAGASLSLRGLGGYDEILVLGAQPAEGAALTAVDLQNLGGQAARATAKADKPTAFVATGLGDATQAAVGAALGAYRFSPSYKSKGADAEPQPLVVITPDAAAAEASYARQGQALADAVAFTRDLITEPSNVVYPQVFVERTQAAFKGVPGVTIESFDEAQMRKMGMTAILSVGMGSPRPPRLLVVHYKGAGATGAPIVLTGKGITFDSGGTSIKPGSGMWRMKGDMAGAAAVVGTVLSLAKSGAPVNVVAVAALAENMPDGGAARPGDVIRAYNGKSIERLNTDAEGRIVLSDATAYADSRFKPAAIVNIATLTGAVGTALGDDYAGLFSRHDGLAEQVQAASQASGEPVWRLPLHSSYAKDLESPVADIRDIAEGGGAAGAGIGAHFIGYFADPATPWAHLDIAAVSYLGRDQPTAPSGAQGFGVRLLDSLVRNFDAAKAAQK